MALIECKNCGHMISDKAQKCPKCGNKVYKSTKFISIFIIFLFVLATLGALSPLFILLNCFSFNYYGFVEYYGSEVQNSIAILCGFLLFLFLAFWLRKKYKNGNMKWCWIIASAVWSSYLVLILTYGDSNDRWDKIAAEERAYEIEIERIRFEREQAVLDSLRQDSIRRREFTSPDLTIHELHGDVKYIIQNGDTTKFDEKGNWIPQWKKEEMREYPELTSVPKYERDKDGKIVKIRTIHSSGNIADLEYEWQDDRISSVTAEYEGYTAITYEEGFRIYDESILFSIYQTAYYDYCIDDLGNWVSRKQIQLMCNMSGSVLGFGDEAEKREIVYWKSNGGRVSNRQNTKNQSQIVNDMLSRL